MYPATPISAIGMSARMRKVLKEKDVSYLSSVKKGVKGIVGMGLNHWG